MEKMIDTQMANAIEAMISAGRYNEAEAALRGAIKSNESDFRALAILSDFLRRDGRNADAAASYSKLVTLEPENHRYRLRLANLEFGLERYPAAIENFTIIASSNCDTSTKASALEMLSAAHFRQGRIKDALITIKLALDSAEPTEHCLRMICSMARLSVMANDLHAATEAQSKIFGMIGWGEALERGYNFTKELWFAGNVENFKYVKNALEMMPSASPRRILEIGSFQGMSACYIIDNWFKTQPGIIVCIDPDYQAEFRSNINRSTKPDCLVAVTARSQDALPIIAPGFDFVHIDGLHVAAQVLIDGILSAPLLKAGGYIVFDDYLKEDQSGLGQTVKKGADEFCRIAGNCIEVVKSNRQLICRLTRAVLVGEMIERTIETLRRQGCWLGHDDLRPSTYGSIAEFFTKESSSFESLFRIRWQ
jgi:predicted O-methyltransferase YrrM